MEAPAADWFFHRYGVVDGGNVANDPHGEFTGRNILYQANELEDTALPLRPPVEEVRAALRARRRDAAGRPRANARGRTSTTRFSLPGTAS